jgi:hypothetical protein
MHRDCWKHYYLQPAKENLLPVQSKESCCMTVLGETDNLSKNILFLKTSLNFKFFQVVSGFFRVLVTCVLYKFFFIFSCKYPFAIQKYFLPAWFWGTQSNFENTWKSQKIIIIICGSKVLSKLLWVRQNFGECERIFKTKFDKKTRKTKQFWSQPKSFLDFKSGRVIYNHLFFVS